MIFTFGQQSQPDNEGSGFIEKGIEKGIENGISNAANSLWDKICNAISSGMLELAKDIAPLASIVLVCYYCYLAYMMFFKNDPKYLSKVVPVTMIYIVFRLFWKVVLGI